jgi:hypothetical protein
MASIFDDMFGQSGVTSLFAYGADPDNTLTYYPPGGGSPTSGIVALLGPVNVVEVEGVDGTLRKVYRRDVTVSVDPSSEWGGIADPQLRGEIEVESYRWGIEQTENLGIEGQSANLVGLSLIRKRPIHKGYSGLRQE